MDELKLCLVTDRTQTGGRDLIAVVSECLEAGLRAVQVREKDLSTADLARLCRALRAETWRRGALLIVNDRVDVALAVGADGVQRTTASLPITDIRQIAGTRLKIGASVHSLPEAAAAVEAGADWLIFGPIFDTPSQRAYGPPQGVAALQRLVGEVGQKLPVLAIGGITPERAWDARLAGAFGVAVISAILGAASPGEVTRRFLEKLEAPL